MRGIGREGYQLSTLVFATLLHVCSQPNAPSKTTAWVLVLHHACLLC